MDLLRLMHPITTARLAGAQIGELQMHHKRKGPKSTRAGCLMCKPYKRQGTKLLDRQRHSSNRKLLDGRQQIAEA